MLLFFKDLEETIVALKSQIQSLQQRNTLMQSEAPNRQHRLSSSSFLTQLGSTWLGLGYW